jgi:hypothetical protein
MRLGVPFIAPRQLGVVESIPGRNSCLLSTGAPDSPVHHRTLSGADFFPVLAQPTIEGLEPLAHRTVRCTPDSPVPPSYRWPGHASRADCAADCWLGRPLAHRTVQCTPDSPVNFSRMAPTKSRERPFHQSQPGAPDTVWCTTGQSGAPRLSRVLTARAKYFPIVFSLILALRQIC